MIKERSSPVDIISMRYKESYVKITYSQPSKKGREIFGKLIPFGKEWSPGANEATEITLTKDLTLKIAPFAPSRWTFQTVQGISK